MGGQTYVCVCRSINPCIIIVLLSPPPRHTIQKKAGKQQGAAAATASADETGRSAKPKAKRAPLGERQVAAAAAAVAAAAAAVAARAPSPVAPVAPVTAKGGGGGGQQQAQDEEEDMTINTRFAIAGKQRSNERNYQHRPPSSFHSFRASRPCPLLQTKTDVAKMFADSPDPPMPPPASAARGRRASSRAYVLCTPDHLTSP